MGMQHLPLPSDRMNGGGEGAEAAESLTGERSNVSIQPDRLYCQKRLCVKCSVQTKG